ncbi:NUDIX hydrolase [Gilvimarinus agarilyticus]|uniref:NUDIX hydrolase n=1 Tax=Gilvimarinus agarilyticus TaxID=679259 RepID=UPI00059FCE56|nr:NUDIX domain-containing protein [Gilvimarinus agarilyticus]
MPDTDHPYSNHVEPARTPDNVIKALSIDNLIFGLDHGQLDVMLIKHREGISKGRWGLPGGWIRYDENLRDAASRHLHELTGVQNLYLEQLKTFGRLDRFPSERVVTIAYYALVSAEDYSLVAGNNAADASWFNIRELPELIYDHAEILQYGIEFLQQQVRRRPIGFNLLPEKFTLLELQELYESILGTKLDKPNFRRKIMKMNLLASCEEKQQGVAHRAAKLYRFDEQAYQALTEKGFSFEI